MAVSVFRTSIGGSTFNSVITKVDELEAVFTKTLPAGNVGTVTTRTDADTGILTVASGHGITDSDFVSVFWEGGHRYGVDVTATTATTISIDLGTGTDLPLVTVAIVVSKEETHSIAITGNQLIMFAIDSINKATINFRDGSNASLLFYHLLANEGRLWIKDIDVTNPLAGDVVASVIIANGGTVALTLSIGMLLSTD